MNSGPIVGIRTIRELRSDGTRRALNGSKTKAIAIWSNNQPNHAVRPARPASEPSSMQLASEAGADGPCNANFGSVRNYEGDGSVWKCGA